MMLRLTEIIARAGTAGAAQPEPGDEPQTATTLTLTFEDRRRSRLLVRLDDGTEAALFLPRGTVLREGDVLGGETPGPRVRVRAAAETLSVARTGDSLLLSRGAYHLGNRHVPLQIGAGWLAYAHDHVLDDLARALGLDVATASAPFEPEAGGYRHHGSDGNEQTHAHEHGLGHAHEHVHVHDEHEHEHGREHAQAHARAEPHSRHDHGS